MSETKHPLLNVLIVDDEANIRKALSFCLEFEGHRVTAVGSFRDAVYVASRRSFEVAFVDLRLGTDNGLELIPVLLSSMPWLKIIVITAYASIETAVEAMRRGAADYIPKPFTPAQVKLVVDKIAGLRSLEQKVAALEDALGQINPEIDFATVSPAMQQVMALARQVAPSDANVLLRGESGTGKTVLAREIHAWSGRASRLLAVISCPSLSQELLESELFGHVKGAFTGALRDNPGRIAACDGGTLFLDEIGDLPLSLQPKLLRFLQDREYERVGDHITRRADVRLIAATNIDLEGAVKKGLFREDLFYRINVIQIEIPPLRERREDIEAMALHMLVFFGRANHRRFLGFTDEAITILKNYSWPGNLRELRNVIERTAILSRTDYVGVEQFPERFRTNQSPLYIGDPVRLDTVEEEHIRRVISGAKSLQEAADILGIDQATLWRKRKQYGI